MAQPEFRADFFRLLEEWVESIEFKAIACVIKKEAHLQKYRLSAMDPYHLSLSLVVERFVFETGAAGGIIVAEARDETLHNALELAFLDLKIRGTQFISATKIRNRIHNFSIRGKKDNLAGLQLADLIATPVGRHVLGKKTYPSYSRQGDFYLTIEKKLRKDWGGNPEGMGLVVLPK